MVACFELLWLPPLQYKFVVFFDDVGQFQFFGLGWIRRDDVLVNPPGVPLYFRRYVIKRVSDA